MKRYLSIIIIAVATCLSAWSQLLWKVEGNGLSKPSYLVGTHHFAPASFIDSIAGLNDAINNCDAVYGEMHRDAMTSMESQQKLAMALIAPQDSMLNVVLTPEQYATVEKVVNSYLAPMGVSLDMLKQLKPQGINIQLQALQAKKFLKDFDPNNLIDTGLQKRGADAGKQLGGFETVDDQIEALFSSTLKEQAEALVDMCEHDAEFNEVSEKLTKAYFNQDLDYMLKQFIDPDAGAAPTEKELENLLWGRNRRWVEKLTELMPQQSILVCVGAGHLPGDKGVVALLRNAGYTVTPCK